MWISDLQKPHRRDYFAFFSYCLNCRHLTSSALSSILAAFAELLPQLLTDFFQKVLIGFGEHAMALKKKPFACGSCGNDKDFTWKTRHGKKTKIHAFYRWVQLQQLQVRCKRCGSKLSITRKLLGIEPNAARN